MLSLITWKLLAGALLAVSPILSYSDTIWSIYVTKQCAGFSLDLTAIMLISSIMRVFFYFGEPYEKCLLLQSVLMIVVHLVLLYLVLEYRVVHNSSGINNISNNSGGSSSMSTISEPSIYEKLKSHARTSSVSVSGFPEIITSEPDNNNNNSINSINTITDILVRTEEHHLDHRKSFTESGTDTKTEVSATNFNSRLLPVSEHEGDAFLKQDLSVADFSNQSNSTIASTAASAYQRLAITRLSQLFDKKTLQVLFSSYSNRPFGFWQWNSPAAYWIFLGLFTILLVFLHISIGTRSLLYVQTIGLVGLLLEAVLPLPQILINHHRHSVSGFRLSLLANWLGGDISKLFYYMLGTTSPEKLASQFIFCVTIQTVLDLFAGWQYVYYNYMYNGPVKNISSSSGSSIGSLLGGVSGNGNKNRTRAVSFQLPVFAAANKFGSGMGRSSHEFPLQGGSSSTTGSSNNTSKRESIEMDVVPFPEYISKPHTACA